MLLRVVLRPKQAAETARIVKSQNLAAVEDQIPVFMRFGRRLPADETQAARHPQMNNERAGVELNDQVFRAPVDRAYAPAASGRFEIRGDWPAQAAIADDQVDDAGPNECGRNAAPRGFYFRKLWHRCAGPIRLKQIPPTGAAFYLIFDSL